MNATSLARLQQLNPALGKLIVQLCEKFDAQFPGWHLEITQGLRSVDEQQALYAQGRETTANVNVLRADVNWAPITDAANIVVTEAAPGYSWHGFGLAADVAPESATGIDWNANDVRWQWIVGAGEGLGLKSGISWKDEPHFQLANIPVTPTTNDRIMLAQNGLAGVWAAVDGTFEAT